jgi:hypothetical protein
MECVKICHCFVRELRVKKSGKGKQWNTLWFNLKGSFWCWNKSNMDFDTWDVWRVKVLGTWRLRKCYHEPKVKHIPMLSWIGFIEDWSRKRKLFKTNLNYTTFQIFEVKSFTKSLKARAQYMSRSSSKRSTELGWKLWSKSSFLAWYFPNAPSSFSS